MKRSTLAAAGATGLGVAALLVGGDPAGAADRTVAVIDFAFSPGTVTVAPGDTVTWDFQAGGHTTTSDQGFWNSGERSAGDTFARTFRSAGSYGYHCIPHRDMGMVGKVRVTVRASGSAGNGWTLRWATVTAGAGRNYDVQYKRQSASTWKALRTDTKNATAFFNPSKAGTYQVRARTSNTDAGESTGWSPVRSVKIS